MIDIKKEKNIYFIISFFVLAFISATWLLRSIKDPDFFWHLKTGQWIWENQSLPFYDYFSFTTLKVLNWRQEFILSSYWLTQVLFYGFYSIAGWLGILVYRYLIFAVFFLTFHFLRRWNQLVWIFYFSFCLVLILTSYPIERPQFLSFIFFGGFFVYLDSLFLRNTPDPCPAKKTEFIYVGLLMLVWANLHGGVVLGQGMFLLTGIFALFDRLRLNDPTLKREKLRLLFISLVGILASFINPNGLRFIEIISELGGAKNKLLYAVNDEYVSLITLLQKTPEITAYFYCATAFFVGLIILLNFRKWHPFRTFVLVSTMVYAILNVRYMPFFLLSSIPAVVQTFSDFKPCYKMKVSLVGIFLFSSMFIFGWQEFDNISSLRRDGVVSKQEFPVQLIDQIQPHNLKGRLYNPDEWGGYLMWRLGPDIQVFWDGRQLDEGVVRDALSAELPGLSMGGRPAWQMIFDKYAIDYAVLPLKKSQGLTYLAMELYRHPAWKPLAYSANSVLVARQNL